MDTEHTTDEGTRRKVSVGRDAARAVTFAAVVAMAGCGGVAAAPRTPAPAATPSIPPATPDLRAIEWTQTVRVDASRMEVDVNAVSTGCVAASALALVACRQSLVQEQKDASQFLSDLSNTETPPVDQRSDGLLRQALADYVSGCTLGIKGIDDSNGTELADGTSQMRVGESLLEQAIAAVATPQS